MSAYVWIIERMAGRIDDRELHARISDALVALQSNVQWLIRRYNDGDVEMMDEVELAARRHLAMVRQLLPRVEAAAKRNHPHRLAHPHLPVGPGAADRVTAIYQ